MEGIINTKEKLKTWNLYCRAWRHHAETSISEDLTLDEICGESEDYEEPEVDNTFSQTFPCKQKKSINDISIMLMEKLEIENKKKTYMVHSTPTKKTKMCNRNRYSDEDLKENVSLQSDKEVEFIVEWKLQDGQDSSNALKKVSNTSQKVLKVAKHLNINKNCSNNLRIHYDSDECCQKENNPNFTNSSDAKTNLDPYFRKDKLRSSAQDKNCDCTVCIGTSESFNNLNICGLAKCYCTTGTCQNTKLIKKYVCCRGVDEPLKCRQDLLSKKNNGFKYKTDVPKEARCHKEYKYIDKNILSKNCYKDVDYSSDRSNYKSQDEEYLAKDKDYSGNEECAAQNQIYCRHKQDVLCDKQENLFKRPVYFSEKQINPCRKQSYLSKQHVPKHKHSSKKQGYSPNKPYNSSDSQRSPHKKSCNFFEENYKSPRKKRCYVMETNDAAYEMRRSDMLTENCCSCSKCSSIIESGFSRDSTEKRRHSRESTEKGRYSRESTEKGRYSRESTEKRCSSIECRSSKCGKERCSLEHPSSTEHRSVAKNLFTTNSCGMKKCFSNEYWLSSEGFTAGQCCCASNGEHLSSWKQKSAKESYLSKDSQSPSHKTNEAYSTQRFCSHCHCTPEKFTHLKNRIPKMPDNSNLYEQVTDLSLVCSSLEQRRSNISDSPSSFYDNYSLCKEGRNSFKSQHNVCKEGTSLIKKSGSFKKRDKFGEPCMLEEGGDMVENCYKMQKGKQDYVSIENGDTRIEDDTFKDDISVKSDTSFKKGVFMTKDRGHINKNDFLRQTKTRQGKDLCEEDGVFESPVYSTKEYTYLKKKRVKNRDHSPSSDDSSSSHKVDIYTIIKDLMDHLDELNVDGALKQVLEHDNSTTNMFQMLFWRQRIAETLEHNQSEKFKAALNVYYKEYRKRFSRQILYDYMTLLGKIFTEYIKK